MQDGFEIRQIRISREPDSRERTKLVSGKLGSADRCADQFEPLSECLTGDHLTGDHLTGDHLSWDHLSWEHLSWEHLSWEQRSRTIDINAPHLLSFHVSKTLRSAIAFSNGVFVLGLCLCLIAVPIWGEEPPVGKETHAIPQSDPTGEMAIPSSKRVKSVGQHPNPAATPKVARYAQSLFAKYDQNQDGKLQKKEWERFQGHPELIDLNRDDVVTRDELIDWIADYGRRKNQSIGVPAIHSADGMTESGKKSEPDEQADVARVNSESDSGAVNAGPRRRDLQYFVPAKRLPAGLPDWFLTRDLDGDGQLTAAEFSPMGLAAELAEFAAYDLNADGILTAKECVRKATGKSAALKPE